MKKTLIIIISFFCFNFVQAEEVEIPKVYFYGNITKMVEKNDVRGIELKYTSKELNFKAYATIKVQGDSSLSYTKKNYNISLFEDTEHKNKKYIDVKWGKLNKYTLKANWIDKTHSRNIVSAKIASQMQRKYNLFGNCINNSLIDGFPVEIYINDEFLGLYTWNIHKDFLFKTKDDTPNLLVLSGQEHNNVTNFKKIADSTWQDFEVEVGEENEENLEKLNRLIKFVNNSSDEEFKKEFENHFNLDSVLNYYCFMRYAQLVDNKAKNLFLVTYDGKIWYTALYDLDTSWGTSFNGRELLNFRNDMSKEIQNSRLWSRLEQNFPNHIVIRYNELRKEILTEENIMNEFNKFYNKIPKSSFILEEQKYQSIPGYDLSTIERFLKIRTKIIDKKVNSLKNDEYEKICNSFSLEQTCCFKEEKKYNTKSIVTIYVIALLLIFSFYYLIFRRNKIIKK